MSSVVSRYVTQILCGNQGCLDFKQLDRIVGQKFTVADDVLLGILCDRGKYAISKGEGKASRLAMSQNSVIVAKTSLRVCQSPPGDCIHCENLHLCRYFVCGNCRFGNKCKNAHSLDSPHNTALIRSVDHHELGEAELFPLLLQNDPYLMPEATIQNLVDLLFSSIVVRRGIHLNAIDNELKSGSFMTSIYDEWPGADLLCHAHQALANTSEGTEDGQNRCFLNGVL